VPEVVTVKIHDVAAISQVPNVTRVIRGGKVSIDVTAKNLGNFTETFYVTCYYDSNPIGTQLVSSLAPGVSTIKTFCWDTTEVALDTYHIKAWVDSTNVILESDETNNNCTSFVTVTVYQYEEPGALCVDKAKTAVISGPDPPVVGFTTVYELTILVTNPGGSTVTNVVVNDTISSDVTFVSVGTPSQGSITTTPPPKIVWNVGSLNAGGSATLTFRISVKPTALGSLYLNHKEHLTASGIDSSTGNPVSDVGDTDVTVAVIAHDVAAISQVPSSTIVLQGDSVAIYVTVQNQGTQSETFNVTCYYSDGLTDIFIGRLRVYSLSAGDSVILTFGWNTMGVAPGIYNIRAWADSGMEIAESDETDNWCTASATVEIVIHDVATTSQTPNPTVVTQGGSVTINVVVENQGSKSETFQVTCYYDDNPVGSPQSVTNLAPNTSTTLVFIWVTTGVPSGVYYIYAVASTVPGEKDTSDNTCRSVETVTVMALQQYLVVFSETGLGDDATGAIVTVNGSGKIFAELPFSLPVDNGTIVYYSYTSIVSSSVSGKRYRLNSVTGPTSPITVTSNVTVTGNYITQYQVIFNQTGLSWDATGTVVTVDSEPKTYANLPFHKWVDTGSKVYYSYEGTVSSSVSGKRYRLDSVTGPSSPITLISSVTVTGNYKTQYRLEVYTDPAGLSPQPSRSPPGEPGSWWYDVSTVVTLTAQSVSGYDFVKWDVDGTPKNNGANPITVTMNAPHTATAHYQRPPPPPSVGGHAEFINEAYPSASRPSFAQILTLLILAFALAITTILFKWRSKIYVMRKIS